VEAAEGVETLAVGQHEVEQNYIGRVGGQRLRGFLGAADVNHVDRAADR
jgi:hypothetical protein